MLVEFPYNRSYAVEYARKWALSRNPLFPDFTGRGGNCTNFVSQCLLAGCSVMDFTPTFGWYFRTLDDRAPSWTGVAELYGFLTGSGDFTGMETEGPFAAEARNRRQIEVGDVVQLANSEGNFYHTLIISAFSGSEVLVCGHSDDALDRPLSSYNYDALRVLHIEGAAIRLPTEECVMSLYNAAELKTVAAEARAVNAGVTF